MPTSSLLSYWLLFCIHKQSDNRRVYESRFGLATENSWHINGRRFKWNTTSMENDINGRQPQWKTTSRKPYRKQMTSACLVSQFQFRTDLGPAQPQLVLYFVNLKTVLYNFSIFTFFNSSFKELIFLIT